MESKDLIDKVTSLDDDMASLLHAIKSWIDGPMKDHELPQFARYGARIGPIFVRLNTLYVEARQGGRHTDQLRGNVRERLCRLAGLFSKVDGLWPYAAEILEEERSERLIDESEQWWLTRPFELREVLHDQVDQVRKGLGFE